jgi:hypothetical protein
MPIRPVNGKVNVGGGHETLNMTNLNPVKPGSGGPSSGIPIHVNGSDQPPSSGPSGMSVEHGSRRLC